MCEKIFSVFFLQKEKLHLIVKAYIFLEEKMPEVGIFWIYHGKLIFKDAVSVEKGFHYGQSITGCREHSEYWDELDADGKLSCIPPSLRTEYFNIPRGMVVYHSETGRYCILHGNNISTGTLLSVAKAFDLPKENTFFEEDIQYCDLSDKEWKSLISKNRKYRLSRV